MSYIYIPFLALPRCLKITEKVSINVYILSVQKLIKMPKKVQFGEFLKN